MSQRKSFDDGSAVEWIDRETLRFEHGDYTADVWVDYEPGWFSRGRIIRAQSLKTWTKCPAGADPAIAEAARAEIVRRIVEYLGNRRVSVDE